MSVSRSMRVYILLCINISMAHNGLTAAQRMPIELFRPILEHASPSTLREVASTSSILYSEAVRRLYCEIVIHDIPSPFLASYHPLSQEKKRLLGGMIHSLIIHLDSLDIQLKSHPEFKLQRVGDLLKHCQQLRFLILMIPSWLTERTKLLFPLRNRSTDMGFTAPALKFLATNLSSGRDGTDSDLVTVLKGTSSLEILDLSSDSESIHESWTLPASLRSSLVHATWSLPPCAVTPSLFRSIFQLPLLRTIGFTLVEDNTNSSNAEPLIRDFLSIDDKQRSHITEIRVGLYSISGSFHIGRIRRLFSLFPCLKSVYVFYDAEGTSDDVRSFTH